MKNLKIIYLYFSNSLQQLLLTPSIFIMFLFTKIARYGLFLIFLYFLVSGLSSVGGYTKYQILLFYLTFNLIDTLAQLLFREVYRFRPLVVSGNFDLVLVKPFNPLLRSLLGGPDFIDMGILVIILAAIFYLSFFFIKPDLVSLLSFVFLMFNSLIMATAFHICVLAIGILTLSVDHLIMIFRDLTSLVRIPVDLYTQPLRSLITFVIPLGIMFSFPPKALLGLLTPSNIVASFLIGVLSLYFSLRFWSYSLRHYSSASS
jgi:ABC-2 type transport system permease protein